MGSPNFLAYIALLAWIPMSLLAYAFLRPPVATVAVLMGGMLLLPARVAFDLPGLPAFDKELIANFCALLGVLFFARGSLRGQRLGRGLDIFVLLLLVGTILTPLANRDAIYYQATTLEAMSPWDSLSDSVPAFLNVGVPFLLGRTLFRRSRDLRLLFSAIVLAALGYSIFVLFELRMSPQINHTVYGYFQHAFHQTLRGSGYRPMVFMSHGLALAMFLLVAALAAAALARGRLRAGPIPSLAAALYLTVLLVLCRSFAAIVYGVVSLALVAFARPRLQMRVAAALAVLVLVYPILRERDLFPTTSITALASRIDEERAQSLQFRFDNEDRLLDRARERLWLGWGGYNRNRVFDERTGEDESVTDGYWILQLGMRGVVGFISVFALLILPVWRANWQLSRLRARRDRILVASLGLMLAVSTIDLIPNGFFSSFTVLLAGALEGLLPGLREEQARGFRAAKVAVPMAAEKVTARAPKPGLRDLLRP